MNSITKCIEYGSASDIPFDDNCFDLVICCNILINLKIDDVKKAIKGIMRVGMRHKFIQTPACPLKTENCNLLNCVTIPHTVYEY